MKKKKLKWILDKLEWLLEDRYFFACIWFLITVFMDLGLYFIISNKIAFTFIAIGVFGIVYCLTCIACYCQMIFYLIRDIDISTFKIKRLNAVNGSRAIRRHGGMGRRLARRC